MGYWNANIDGNSLLRVETGIVWGDSPADIFDQAIEDIVRVFQEDVGRKPTRTEIEAGLQFSLSIYEDET